MITETLFLLMLINLFMRLPGRKKTFHIVVFILILS